MKLVNPEAVDTYHGQKLWRIDAMYSAPIFVFAPNEQEAFDETIDESDHLDYLKCDTSEWTDEQWENPEGCFSAGNASEYIESDYLRIRCLGEVTWNEMLESHIEKEGWDR